jgi:two-component system, OmpR family, phosphate regulon sensor histidine kinase PhoR
VRVSPFWRSGLTFSILLLATLPALDFYISRQIYSEAIAGAYQELEALAQVARTTWPDVSDVRARATWLAQMAASGAGASVVGSDGRVIAQAALPGRSETREGNHDEPVLDPDLRQAVSSGEGRAMSYSAILKRDVIYLTTRLPISGAANNAAGASPATGSVAGSIGGPVFLRLALPVPDIGLQVSEFRRRLWAGSLIFVLFVAGGSLLISRTISRRIRELKQFSGRVAGGDFRPLEIPPGGDELDDLARALNHTAAQLDGTIRVLTDERNRSAAILRSMIEGVAVISAQERVLFSNRAFSQILGLEAIVVEGRPLVEVVRQSDLLAVIKRALAHHEEISSEIVVGTVRPRSFAVTASPVRAEGPTGAVLVLHEISELRRLERVRQDFVANISHEFRTPLTAIQGFAETLLGGALDDTANRRRFVEIIRNHATRLARLTEDLLELSRIEAGQLELEFRPVSVEYLIESCLETARLKAAQRDLIVEVSIPDGLPSIRGDANRLQEVLQNLLDNAVQYTPEKGRIEVQASQVGGAVVLTVADTGIGIPQAEQGRIFERFYRVDAARSREAGGTGLGLSIARHIVDAHGGKLWVESAVGEGSRFHFSIPVS